ADAKLAIIIVSDADDSSPQPVSFYSTFFKALKNQDPSMFVFSGIVAPANLSACPNAESSGLRYMQLAAGAGGATENICTSNWAQALSNLSANAFGPRRQFELSQKPMAPATAAEITVSVNG